MAGSPEEDVTAAHGILQFQSQGHIFEQEWNLIPENDHDLVKIIQEDAAHHAILQEDSRRGVKKCCPIIS
jgi:ribulose-bisphosphate carboxylase large chain